MLRKLFVVSFLLSVFWVFGSGCVAGEPVDWGVLWGDMSKNERSFYLLGYRDGLQMSSVGAKHGLEINNLGHGDGAMSVVVTDLYKDANNSGIPINLMVIVAKDRLDGVDIRETLRRFRRGIR